VCLLERRTTHKCLFDSAVAERWEVGPAGDGQPVKCKKKKNCNLFFDGWTHVAGDESPKNPYTLTMMFNTDLT
jgi:hypothetical protein